VRIGRSLFGVVAPAALIALAACQQKAPNAGSMAASQMAPSAADMAASQAAIDSVRTAWATDAQNHDWAALAGLYADDAVNFNEDGTVNTGRAAIQASFSPGLDSVKSVTITPSGGTQISGDVAFESGDYSNTVTVKGKDVQAQGHYLVVLKKEGGAWQIVRDANINVPAAGAASGAGVPH
jgi:uncharacterized protein (TIGR02246 family)